jgi:cyclase
MMQVCANVYVECGFGGCNVGFVTTTEGIVIIDTPLYPTNTMRWRDEISKRGEVKYLITTDPHPDHNSGSHFLPGIYIAHRESRERLLERTVDEVIGLVTHTDAQGLVFMEDYQVRLPDITFTESLNLYLGGLSFELIHLPGHAPGVIGVYIPEERIVFASDCVFCREKSYLHEATPHQWLESLERLGQLDADIIVPGHGVELCNKEYLDEQANIIRNWVEVVMSAINNGLSVEEAAAKVRCPDPYKLPKEVPWSEDELNGRIVNQLYQLLKP